MREETRQVPESLSLLPRKSIQALVGQGTPKQNGQFMELKYQSYKLRMVKVFGVLRDEGRIGTVGQLNQGNLRDLH